MRALFICLLPLAFSSYAQTNGIGTIKVKKLPADTVYSVVEQMPEFPGGTEALMAFISSNFVYPRTALEKGISGTVYITFVVAENGSLSGLRVIKGIPGCPECDSEALRVIGMMPGFIPGKKAGTPVKVQFNLPIRFRLR
ncbi:MAG TPA: energy transducer TonB [Bacteroidia bacterium]|jgi:protein TonB